MPEGTKRGEGRKRGERGENEGRTREERGENKGGEGWVKDGRRTEKSGEAEWMFMELTFFIHYDFLNVSNGVLSLPVITTL